MKIYATDIDEDALQQGRHAEYTAAQLDPVPPELRQRYFEARNGNFVFRGDLRRGVIFGRHDLIQDPPISRISLLLSRNTLMYFDSNTQARILANFHFSLRDNGFLFLGKSEALAARSELFVPVDLKRRVFAKAPRDAPRRLYVAPPTGAEEDQLARLASDALIREAGFETVPVAQIVVDRDENVVLANLQARAFFGLSQRDIGRPLKDLDVSFKPVELRSRIEQVTNERHVVALRDVEWNVGSELRYLDVQVAPLISTGGDLLGTGISFIEVTRYRRLQEALQDSRREIETAYEELQSTVEELETTNEELQSTNEELETTNEELQSTNEELETLNEELHSTNEELETMNDELNDRSLELNSANAFLSTVLGSLRAGIIVVNSELVVEAWNEEARDLWGLSQDEVLGKHLFNLDIGLPLDQLRGPLRETIAENDGQRELSVTAVNRRGRQIECRISLTPLGNPTDGHGGAIVMMQPSDAAS